MNTKITAKTFKKSGQKIMKIVGIIFSFMAVALLIGSILHATYYTKKFAAIQPYGTLVNVYDGQMHVTSRGSGEKTIVLLPGLGVALPSAEFGPLMRKLSEKYTVVTVEYFGTGFSSETERARTAENYVEEIRTALQAAGFEAPYVLMPHSISSVYGEYYAEKYPEEVEAILSLDGTSTAYYAEGPKAMKSLLSIAKFQQGCGMTSILAPLALNKDNLRTNGYTEQEINDLVVVAGFSMNNTVIEQMANSAEFIKETMAYPYPEQVPYFKIIARDTYEKPNPQLQQAGMTPQEYQEKHLARIGDQVEYEILDGTHFIYATQAERISEIADEFLLNN